MEESKRNSKIGKVYLPWKPKSISRTRMDIKTWNTGLNMARMAENPQNWALQLTYDECDLDALVSSQWENRKNQVFSSTFSLKTASGDVDEEQTKILKKHPLYRKISKAAYDSILFGYNLGELKYKKAGGEMKLNFELVPRYNVVPQTGMFYPEYGDPSNGIAYRDLPEFGTWILEFNSGTPGLMNKLVPMALFSRFMEASWSELGEIYGIPPRVMKTNTQDPAMLKRAEAMMRDMGSAAWFIIDETEEFEFAKGVSTNGDVYNNFLKHCGAKICNLISGGMIGQDTQNGNRAKDEVSMEMLWLLVQSDMAMLEEAWNETVIPALVKHGVLKEGLTFEFNEAEDIGQLWKFVQGLLGFFEIDPEWIRQKFGVEVTGAKAQNDTVATLAAALAASGGGDPAPPFPAAPGHTGACCGSHLTARLSLPKDAPKSDGLIQRIGKAKGKSGFDPELFWETGRTLIKGLNEGLDGRKIKLVADFTYGVDDPHLFTSFELNLHRFSAGKTLAQVQALNEVFRNARTYDIFRTNAKRIGDVWNDAWLKTEYDTATLVGESTTNFYNLMQDVETFPYWEYRTVGDSQVRAEHAALDGLILPANDPVWQKLFPPNGWNCRCYVVARTREEVAGVDFNAMRLRADEHFASGQFSKAASQGFGVNRAVTGEVFTANQQYVTGKNLSGTNRQLNSLGEKDYEIPSYAADRKRATAHVPKYKGTPQDWLSARDTLDGVPTLYDYNGRALSIEEGMWERHTEGKNGKRNYLLDALVEVLESPDQLWLRGKTKTSKMDDLVYIKYYLDETVVAIGRQNQSNIVELNTWFKLSEKESVIESYRRGLLVKK